MKELFQSALSFICEVSEHGQTHSVEAFDLAVPLRMIRSCSGASDPAVFLKFGKQLVFKLLALVMVEFSRKSQT